MRILSVQNTFITNSSSVIVSLTYINSSRKSKLLRQALDWYLHPEKIEEFLNQHKQKIINMAERWGFGYPVEWYLNYEKDEVLRLLKEYVKDYIDALLTFEGHYSAIMDFDLELYLNREDDGLSIEEATSVIFNLMFRVAVKPDIETREWG